MLLSVVQVLFLFRVHYRLESATFYFFLLFLLSKLFDLFLLLLFELSNLFLLFLGVKLLSCLISVKILSWNKKFTSIFLSVLSNQLEISFVEVRSVFRVLQLHGLIRLQVFHRRYSLYLCLRIRIINERVLLVCWKLWRRFVLCQSFSYLSLGKPAGGFYIWLSWLFLALSWREVFLTHRLIDFLFFSQVLLFKRKFLHRACLFSLVLILIFLKWFRLILLGLRNRHIFVYILKGFVGNVWAWVKCWLYVWQHVNS